MFTVVTRKQNHKRGVKVRLVISMLLLFMVLTFLSLLFPSLPETWQHGVLTGILVASLCVLSYGYGRHFSNVMILMAVPIVSGLAFTVVLHQVDFGQKLTSDYIVFLSFTVGLFSLASFMKGATKPTLLPTSANEKKENKREKYQTKKKPKDDSPH